MPEVFARLDDISVRYGPKIVMQNLSLEIVEGAITCIIGLSGGMVKRAGFARAVITNPQAVLYDEPTTGLDPIITHLLTDLIKKLRERLRGTAVVVSHDLESIYMMADYIAMLFEGAIVAYGTVDEIKRSPNPIVQQFLQGSEVGPIPI